MEEECRRSEQLGVTMRFLLGLRREKHIFGLGLPSDPVDPVEQVEHMYLWRLIASDPRIKEYVNAITENIKLNDLSKQGVLIDPLVVGVDLCQRCASDMRSGLPVISTFGGMKGRNRSLNDCNYLWIAACA